MSALQQVCDTEIKFNLWTNSKLLLLLCKYVSAYLILFFTKKHITHFLTGIWKGHWGGGGEFQFKSAKDKNWVSSTRNFYCCTEAFDFFKYFDSRMVVPSIKLKVIVVSVFCFRKVLWRAQYFASLLLHFRAALQGIGYWIAMCCSSIRPEHQKFNTLWILVHELQLTNSSQKWLLIWGKC